MTNHDLKAWRYRMGLSITQAARALNHPTRTYENWERGDRKMPGSVVRLTEYIEKYGVLK